MKSDVTSRIASAVKRSLATLAIITGLCAATPSAFAQIDLSWSAEDINTSQTTSGGPIAGNLSTGTKGVGNFAFSVTSNTSDPTGTGLLGNGTFPSSNTSELSTTTFTITSSVTDTLEIKVTGVNFTVGAGGPADTANYSVSGSSSNSQKGDKTTGYAYVDGTNTAFGTGTQIPPGSGLTGTPNPPSQMQSKPYLFTNGGESGEATFVNSSKFSITQVLDVYLIAGDSVTLTINTTVVPVPEPSTMAIAGLGALGMIGFGLRRRKVKGA
jgi:hypothetical protein